MRVVVLVAIVGDSVESPGGDGTLTAWPPLGAPNGYRFGLGVVATGAVIPGADLTIADEFPAWTAAELGSVIPRARPREARPVAPAPRASRLRPRGRWGFGEGF